MKKLFACAAVVLAVLIVSASSALAAPGGYGRGYGRGCGYGAGYGRGYCYYYNNTASTNAASTNTRTAGRPYGYRYVDKNNDGICDNYQNGTYNPYGRGWRYWAQ